MTPEELIATVRRIELSARNHAHSFVLGAYQSAFRGSGMHFKEFRNYVFGDDVRHISWTVSARSENTVLKVFEEERERTIYLVVDRSASLRLGPWAHAKAIRLAEIGATLAVAGLSSNDSVGMILYSDDVESIVEPKKGRGQLLRLIRDLLTFEPSHESTNPNRALEYLLRAAPKHSVIALLSDMEVLPDAAILNRLGRSHDVIAFHVKNPLEWNLEDFGFVELLTAEAKRPATIDTSDSTLQRHLAQHHKNQHDRAQIHFAQSGVPLFSTSTTEQNLANRLQQFFSSYSRRKR